MNKEAVILIPCYDPNEKIMTKFLNELSQKFENIVIIDDGCSKKHQLYMDNLSKDYVVFKHHVNLGKGRGIKNGINYILNNYQDSKVIITADCDGQHSVLDILKVYKVALNYQDSMILGCRDFNLSSVPFKSRYGNTITKNILRFFNGIKISDTQTGLRALSFDVAEKLIAIPGERYEYETNTLISSKKLNIPLKEVEIDTIYIDNNKTSHFNPVKDSIRIYKFFAKALIFSLISYILEVIMFAIILSKTNILIALIASKALNVLLNYIFNKSVSNILVLLSLIINAFILEICSLVNINLIIIKIIIDILILVYNLLFSNFKVEKVTM